MATSAQVDALVALYAGYFNRAPDPEGLQFWIDQIDGGREFNTIAADFAASEEATALYPYLTTPDVATPSTFITSIYQNLFNRAPDAEGLQFWTDVLEAGSVSVADMIEAIINGAVDAPDATPPTFDATTLENKIEVGRDFAQDAANTSGFEFDAEAKSAAIAAIDGVTNDEATVVAAKAATDAYLAGEANEGDTFTLTAGTDIVDGTAANDTVVASVDTDTAANSTLNVSDVITGGAGTDKLQITVAGTAAGSLPAADITGVENFFVRDVAGTASTYDFASATGEQQVWADRATNDVDFDNLGTGATVGVKGNGSTDLGNVDFNMATATDAVNVVLSGGVKNSTAAPTITATAGAATAAALTSMGAANTVGAVTLSGGTNTIETLDITASTDLTADLQAADYDSEATLNISGAGDVDLSGSGVTTFDTIAAGTATGDLMVAANTTTAKVTLGSGNDTLTVAANLVDGASIALGAGNDTLTGSNSVSADVTVDGGEGTDSVSSSFINAGNGGNFNNFETLLLNSAGTLDLDLLTGSTIEALELGSGANITLQNVATSQSLSVVENGATGAALEFDGVTGASDSYSISFDAETTGTTATPAPVAAGTVTVNGIESISVASGSAAGVNANSITLDADTAETVTITGDQALTLDFVAGFGSDADGDEVTAIDGSAATGDLDIDITNVTADAAGLAVTGGAGEDTITTGAFKVSVTGGAGDDTFEVDASNGLGQIVSITDLAVGDMIDFGAGAFNATKVDVSGATDLEGAVELADAAGAISYFDYSGNTYVVGSGATASDASDDSIVKLAGIVDLSDSTDAGGVLTFA